MVRPVLCLLLAGSAVAQTQPREDPLMAAIRAHQKAREEGRFDEAAAKRELARGVLDQIPAGTPQFANRVFSVTQLYQNSGLTAKALAVAQQALSRADGHNRI